MCRHRGVGEALVQGVLEAGQGRRQPRRALPYHRHVGGRASLPCHWARGRSPARADGPHDLDRPRSGQASCSNLCTRLWPQLYCRTPHDPSRTPCILTVSRVSSRRGAEASELHARVDHAVELIRPAAAGDGQRRQLGVWLLPRRPRRRASARRPLGRRNAQSHGTLLLEPSEQCRATCTLAVNASLGAHLWH
jgi:hypothetical protein